MPRQARLNALGALYYIMSRGIERRKISRGDRDRMDLLDLLAKLLPAIEMASPLGVGFSLERVEASARENRYHLNE